jgi:23S rRNA (guanosine2251-2'-O)-methyltransferase
MKEFEMIFGKRAIIEAIQIGKKIDKILICKGLQSKLSHELFNIIKETDILIRRVPREKLDRLTRRNHQGLVAFISTITYQKLESIVPFLYEEGKVPLILLLDGITDVHNFGAIARSCECAGVNAIVIPLVNSVSVNADAIKISAGALMSLSVCRESNIMNAVKFLKLCGYKVYAATEKATTLYTKTDYTYPTAIVIGSEDKGISPAVLYLCDKLVKIPTLGNITSLNVSAATAVLLYEVLRQRTSCS